VLINYLRNIYRVPERRRDFVHYGAARKTSMNFDTARLGTREDDATEMEERATHASRCSFTREIASGDRRYGNHVLWL